MAKRLHPNTRRSKFFPQDSARNSQAGALAAYLEASTGRRAYYLGKPNPYMFFRARRLLHRQTHEVMMVGDTMETDIRGAIEIGMQACLVLSGSTRLEDLADYVYQPTCVMSGVDQLLAEIQGHGSTSRLQASSSHDALIFHKIRPALGGLRFKSAYFDSQDLNAFSSVSPKPGSRGGGPVRGATLRR